MKRYTAAIAAAAALLTGCAKDPCAKDPAPEWVEGGLYSTRFENSLAYSVLKVLKTDKDDVHIRVYSNLFPERPTDVDPTTLRVAGKDHGPNEINGIGHLPLTHMSFREWHPVYIETVQVDDDELEDYRMWRESNGASF